MPLSGHTLRAGRRRDSWTFSGLKLPCILFGKGESQLLERLRVIRD